MNKNSMFINLVFHAWLGTVNTVEMELPFQTFYDKPLGKKVQSQNMRTAQTAYPESLGNARNYFRSNQDDDE